MAESTIEWTEQTWNPVTGCHKISAGCKFCYAEIMTRRLKAMGQPKYAAGFGTVVCHESELSRTFGKKPSLIFVNSMSDLFHKDVPLDFIQRTFAAMASQPHHIFQALTKRADRMAELSDSLIWPTNLWMGVSVEDSRVLWRIDHLRSTGAAIKWLSMEPLIGPMLGVNLAGIDWIVVGGESGHGARPMKEHWVHDIMTNCRYMGIAFFFKQWGGTNKKLSGRLLNGRTYDEMPIIH